MGLPIMYVQQARLLTILKKHDARGVDRKRSTLFFARHPCCETGGYGKALLRLTIHMDMERCDGAIDICKKANCKKTIFVIINRKTTVRQNISLSEQLKK